MTQARAETWAEAFPALPNSLPPILGLEDAAALVGLRNHSASLPYRLNMAAVYQDEATRAWAGQTVAEAASLVGEDAVRCQWWDMHQLSDPLVGAEAFRGAEPADMLIVAIRAVERLPVAFYAWISSGLGHRSRRDGLLVALLAASKRPCALRKVLRRYLEGLARSNHLDFLACEQNLAASIP